MQTILVADGQKSWREPICTTLRLSGFKTLEARNGLEVLKLQKAHQPDLILLDVDMPEMDGFETCRILSQTSTVPVLFLTGMTKMNDQEKGLTRLYGFWITCRGRLGSSIGRAVAS